MSFAWIGLGGYKNSSDSAELIQSGIDVDTAGSTVYCQMWDEVFSKSGQKFEQYSNYTPPCGDRFYAVDSNNGSGGTEAYEFIEDTTSGKYLPEEQFGSAWTYQSSVSADWIAERSDDYALTDFSSFTFSDSTAENGSGWYYVGQMSHNYSVMCNDGVIAPCSWPATQCAHPGSIIGSGSLFSVYWDNACH